MDPSERHPRQPDIFLVGAPKSGTTAMHEYLGRHPGIFMAPTKDRPYFASDLEFGRWRLSRPEYESSLAPGRDAPLTGHSCVWYLYSRRAAEEVHAAAPAAKAVIMLRNPVDMLHAQHSQFLYNGNEDITDFGAALAAEPDRRRGRRIPRRAHFAQGLWYVDTARYADQVERYLRVFGDRVRVILYDDFRADPAATAGEVARWLGAPAAAVEAHVVNPNKRLRSRRLQSFLMAPPDRLERAYHAVTPQRVHGRVGRWLIGRNVHHRPRDPLPPELRSELGRTFADDVERLGRLLDRDLHAWVEDALQQTR
jgi:hypothetical protein